MLYKGNDTIEICILAEIENLEKENLLLKDLIKSGNDEIYCAVCGKKISQLSIQRMSRPILWHNRECFQKKPGKIVALERDFGCDIVEVLKETAKRCGNIEAQCHVLDVSIPWLYSMIRKYCGTDHISFFAQNATGKRKELYAKKIRKAKQQDKSKT